MYHQTLLINKHSCNIGQHFRLAAETITVNKLNYFTFTTIDVRTLMPTRTITPAKQDVKIKCHTCCVQDTANSCVVTKC